MFEHLLMLNKALECSLFNPDKIRGGKMLEIIWR